MWALENQLRITLGSISSKFLSQGCFETFSVLEIFSHMCDIIKHVVSSNRLETPLSLEISSLEDQRE